MRRVTGLSQHWLGDVDDEGNLRKLAELPAANWVEIRQGNQGYYLLYFDESGAYITDGWHATFEEAKAQAKFEFEIDEDDWRPIT